MFPIAGYPILLPSQIVGNRQCDELRNSIRNLVVHFESSKELEHGITDLAKRFGIKRRRLYDIINVFEAIEFCEKSDLDKVRWHGRQNIMAFIQKIATDPELYNTTKSVCELFPVSCSVGISSLALSFLRMFYALGTSQIDIRDIAKFLSRGTTRYKSTLCKLYQISYILGSIDILVRNTNQACEVTLQEVFHKFIQKPAVDDPTSLESLLNRREGRISNTIFANRINEIQKYTVAEAGKTKTRRHMPK